MKLGSQVFGDRRKTERQHRHCVWEKMKSDIIFKKYKKEFGVP
jgi:hypothetical protein